MKTYAITTNEELRIACIRNNWFTKGTNEQYKKLFLANETDAPLDEIATIIWLCSDDKWDKSAIKRELMGLREIYGFLLGERQQAQGERDADEVYCGQFD